ncbi:MAG: hypothetical protein P8Z30_08350 [Acidobacteriota bacterium]
MVDQVPNSSHFHHNWYNLLDRILDCMVVYELFGMDKPSLPHPAMGRAIIVNSVTAGIGTQSDFSRREWKRPSGKKLETGNYVAE